MGQERAQNVAIITAAGVGQRMQNEVPKQFLNVLDKPIIIYTLEAFQAHPNIDKVVVACLDGWQEILRAYCRQYQITKLDEIVTGGATGQASIYNCLQSIRRRYHTNSLVLVHDGNRAMVSEEVISDAIRTCTLHGSGIPAVPCTEVVLRTDNGISADENLPREQLRRTQTPHALPLRTLLWAHEEAAKRGINDTVASCDLLVRLGETLFFSAGSEKNLKITTMDDIDIFKALLQMKKADGGYHAD